MKLFKDSLGTIPATVGGLVGLSKRAGGTVDVSQSSDAAKPTLVRWPTEGAHGIARNMWNEIPIGKLTSHWPSSTNPMVLGSSSGIDVTILDRGMKDSMSFMDINIKGSVSTAVPFVFFDIGETIDKTIPSGVENVHISLYSKLLSGTYIQSESRLNLYCNFKTAVGNTKTASLTSSETYYDLIAPVIAGETQLDKFGAYVVCTPNHQIDYTFRIKGLQAVWGSSPKSFQYHYSESDIVPKTGECYYHLYGGSGKSLNVVLASGSYSIASIDLSKTVKYETVVSDGTTPINSLRNDRQLDLIIVEGTLTVSDKEKIENYWRNTFIY